MKFSLSGELTQKLNTLKGDNLTRATDVIDSVAELKGEQGVAAAFMARLGGAIDRDVLGDSEPMLVLMRDARRAKERSLDDTPATQTNNMGERLNGGGATSPAASTNAERFAQIADMSAVFSGRHYARGDDGSYDRVPGARHDPANDPTNDPEYREDFLAYVNSRGRYVGRRLHEVNEFERRALNIGSDGSGVGYLAPGDIRSQILSRLPAVSEFLDLVTTIPAYGDVVKWPRVRGNTTSGFESIYTSAGVGTMIGETPPSGTLTEQKFGTFDIHVKKGRYFAQPSNDALMDIKVLGDFLASDAGINMGLLMESQGLVGSGIGNNVLGIMNNPDIANATDISGTTADQVSNLISDAGSAPKLLTWFYSVPAQYRRDPSFRVLFNSDTERRIRSLVDGNGRFMWSADGGFGSPTDGFLNKPTAISEFIASGGTDANLVGLAGALSSIFLAVNGGLRIQIADQTYIEQDAVGLFVTCRFGFGLSNSDAVRLAKV